MLVATPVANDTRVLREATALVRAGHAVHVVGFGVPPGFAPPDGVTVSSAGRRPRPSRPERPGVAAPARTARRARPLWWRAARWLLLPEHRARTFGRWAREAYADATGRTFDVVHAHDFNTLALGDRLARERGVPLVYDSHELWFGRPVVGRPTPLRDAR
ncbi:MAG: glycosyltransferase, partial [Actinobacteria bacterium]|nr:glycosyltransferase [Actinomycetota bacterium]